MIGGMRQDIFNIMKNLSKKEVKIMTKPMKLKERLDTAEELLRKAYKGTGKGTKETKEVKRLESLINKLRKQIEDDDNL